MRSRCQMETSWPFFDCNSGAIPPRPAGPWQAMHPFCSKTCAPSLALPRPGGSSSPVGPIEISMRRISSAVGVRPTPYVGDCANAVLPRRLPSSSGIVTTLSEAIGHAPVPGDFPGHNAVVQPGHPVVPLEGYFPPIGDLLSHRLPLPDLVGAARQNRGLGSIPLPWVGESDVRHALWSVLELGAVPLLSAIGGYFHGLDGAASGPGEPADLIESGARQPLCAGRVRDDRLGPDLFAERKFFVLRTEMPEFVVVHVKPVDELDAPQKLGVVDALESGNHDAHWKPLLWPQGLAVHAVGDDAVVHRFFDGNARCALHFLGAFSNEPFRAAFQAAFLEQRGQQHSCPFGAAGHPVRILHGLLLPIVPVSRTLDEVQPGD